MPVILRHSGNLAGAGEYQCWFATDALGAAAAGRLDPDLQLDGIAGRLEAAFEAIIADWWALGRELASEPSAHGSHAAACTPNASELGLMLAWAKIIEARAALAETTLVVCDDPWLYRHAESLAGVIGGNRPPLWRKTVQLQLRGLASRLYHGLRLAWTAFRLRHHAKNFPADARTLLVYGHPQSKADGTDAYFGTLMNEVPGLVRLLHVDAPLAQVRRLAADARNFSLHGFGCPFAALAMIATRWRPNQTQRAGRHGWLVRRQAAIEGANAQALEIRWQTHCQRIWLNRARPKLVAWPWENLNWERALVAEARARGVRTLGYQHATIGRHAANQSLAANTDGLDGLPDAILCTGAAGRDQLLAWGVPAARLEIAGAFRAPPPAAIANDPSAPVFVALPMKHAVAHEIVAALGKVTAPDIRFEVKVHPMTELDFADGANLKRTTRPMTDYPALRAVVFAASTVGLEALLAGLPTLRFMPAATVAIDILSPPADAIAVTAETLETALREAAPPPPLAGEQFFAPVDLPAWRRALGAAISA
jgi:hypothetical protein